MAKTLKEVAVKAFEIWNEHQFAAEVDEGIDAGEFSGPSHDRMTDKEIQKLAVENGFTFEQVENEMIRMEYDEMSAPGQNPAGHS